MAPLDIFYIGCGVIFLIYALRSSFLITLISFVAVYISAYFASKAASFSFDPLQMIGMNSGNILKVVIFVSTFVSFVFAIEFLLLFIKKVFNITILSSFDKYAAAFLGFLKGIVVATIISDMLLISPMTRSFISPSITRNFGEGILKATYPAVNVLIPSVETFASKNIMPLFRGKGHKSSSEEVSGIFDSSKNNISKSNDAQKLFNEIRNNPKKRKEFEKMLKNFKVEDYMKGFNKQ